MRIALGARPARGQRLSASAADFADYEKAGVELFTVAELYGFDAVSRLGYLAACTTRAHISSGILQLYSRTPTLLAMTAAGLDDVSDGRFELGIGTSGPQVIEGFHGVPFDAPIGRTRETIEICRMVWRREQPLSYQGKHYTVPLPADQGTGLGKPLKMIDHPFRDRIPITVASIGPRNVTLTAELAEGWVPPFYVPEKAADVWGDSLRAGFAKRDPALGPLNVQVGASVAIGDDVEHLREVDRPQRALYIGGMGALRPQLLQRPGRLVRLPGRRGADPGPLPVRQEEGGRGGRARRPARQDLADRAGRLRARPAARARRVGRHEPERAPRRPGPRDQAAADRAGQGADRPAVSRPPEGAAHAVD